MRKLFTYFLKTWWVPVLFWGLSSALALKNEHTSNIALDIANPILFTVSMLFLVISIIYQLIKKQWLSMVLILVCSAGIIVASLIYMIYVENSYTDKWADHLSIPEGIPVYEPIPLSYNDESRADYDPRLADSLNSRKIRHTDFQIYSTFQPGLYKFDFWTGRIEPGELYLRAFEITREAPLSTERLRENSKMNIYNPTDSVMKFHSPSYCMISEGDWGKPYAARFEVWFKPDAGPERKLFSKNYKIEGWQR